MWKIPLFKIYHDSEDVEQVTLALESGMNWAAGESISAFEEKLAGYHGLRYAITFNSGTSALHATHLAYGIGPGDEVIVPSFTFIATANSPLFTGARPVFADIEEETCGLDPEDVAEKITPRTKAILPIHYGGCPCRIRELKELADDHGLLLIEDAAEAFGAGVHGKMVGTFGDAAMLSFCQNKVITTGEGGAMVTDSQEIAERLKLIRSHGRVETCNYFNATEEMDYKTLGFNFRMSSLTAALGLAQIHKADALIRMRRDRAAEYTRALARSGARCRVPRVPRGLFHVYQIFSVEVENRDELMAFLASRGIMTKVYFPPVHKTSYYRDVLGYECTLPVTERVSERILSIPFHPILGGEEIQAVAGAMAEFYGTD